MQVQPYLFLNGRAAEAIAFYEATLGAKTTAMRFKEAPPEPDGRRPDPAMGDLIMHADLELGATHLLISDGMGPAPVAFQGFSLALTVADAEAADRVFAALGEGGTVRQPLTTTFFSPRFGIVADRFGVSWIVLAQGRPA